MNRRSFLLGLSGAAAALAAGELLLPKRTFPNDQLYAYATSAQPGPLILDILIPGEWHVFGTSGQ